MMFRAGEDDEDAGDMSRRQVFISTIIYYFIFIYFKYLHMLHEFQLHGCFTNCPVLEGRKNKV